MSSYSSEIVIGVDFGTTYSGVSWAVNGGRKNIRVIENWPNPGANSARASNSAKVPSVLSYQNGQPRNWGYTVEDDENAIKWFKILLEPEHKYRNAVQPLKESNAVLQRLGKTPQEAASDYLRLLWRYTKEDIRRHYPDFEVIYALRVVLTVPAIWTPVAKDRTLQAARDAGFPEQITLVTEPEAAALATLKDRTDNATDLNVGDAFVVCDAGGGTVDLISYQVLGLNPLELKECAIGSGDLCGSCFLDQYFENWVITLVGEQAYYRLNNKRRTRMMNSFEHGIKRYFTKDETQPKTVVLMGVEDDPANGIEDGDITVKPAFLRTIFDHVCSKIETLISGQLSYVHRNRLRAKAILLVGGFGDSKYLYGRLEDTFQAGGIQILQNTDAWSSICRGATLWGLEHPTQPDPVRPPQVTVTSRLARYCYGVCVTQPFDPNRHSIQDRFVHKAKGTYWADNQMKWLLRRGEEIREGRALQLPLFESVQVGLLTRGAREFSANLYWCEEINPPSRRILAVKLLCTVKFSIPASKLHKEDSYKHPVTGHKWRDFNFMLEIILGNAALEFKARYKGEIVGQCQAQYVEDKQRH